MKVLIRNAEVVQVGSKHHLKKRNILVENGSISSIDTVNHRADKVVEGDSLKVSVGWFDLHALFGDPGLEFKEDLSSGLKTALHGGFTRVGLLPNTEPAIQTKNDLTYVLGHNARSITQIAPYAAVTKDTLGEDLTDMIDLHHAGAKAFTDGIQPLWKSDILLKTLQYLQKMDGLLISRPEDKYLNMFGNMHEGKNSTILGMKGMPAIAEEIMVARDLKILEYTGGKIHFSNISTKESVRLIAKAKKKGFNVTCDVAAHQLVFTDAELMSYDTNFKVNPPLRLQRDINALIKGVNNNTIDAIVSAHNPQDEESKKLEFDLAEFGTIGLQTVWPALNGLSDQISLAKAIEKLTVGPYQVMGEAPPRLEEGQPANLTVFSTDQCWTLDEKTNASKSINSPWWGKELKGKVVAVFNNKKQVIF